LYALFGPLKKWDEFFNSQHHSNPLIFSGFFVADMFSDTIFGGNARKSQNSFLGFTSHYRAYNLREREILPRVPSAFDD